MDGGFSRRFFFKTFFLVDNHPPSIFTPLRLRRCFAGSFLRWGSAPYDGCFFVDNHHPPSIFTLYASHVPIHSFERFWFIRLRDWDSFVWEIGIHSFERFWFIRSRDSYSFVWEILIHSFERFLFIRLRDSYSFVREILIHSFERFLFIRSRDSHFNNCRKILP